MAETLKSRRLAVMALVLVLSSVLVACGGGDGGGDADLRAEIKTLMMEDGSMSDEEADCFAGIMVDEVDNDVLRAAIDAEAEGVDPEIPDEAISEDVMTRAFEECFDLGDLDLEGVDLEGVDQ